MALCDISRLCNSLTVVQCGWFILPGWRAKISANLSMRYVKVKIAEWNPDGSSRWQKLFPFSTSCPFKGAAHQKKKTCCERCCYASPSFNCPNFTEVLWAFALLASVFRGGWAMLTTIQCVQSVGSILQNISLWGLWCCPLITLFSHSPPTLYFPCLCLHSSLVSVCPPFIILFVPQSSACLSHFARSPHGDALISQDHLLSYRRRHLLCVYHHKQRAESSRQRKLWRKWRSVLWCDDKVNAVNTANSDYSVNSRLLWLDMQTERISWALLPTKLIWK